MTRTVAILAFHKIGDPPPGTWRTWNYIAEDVFGRYLERLRSGGWTVITVPALLAGLARPAGLPRRAALLTFDDGYRLTLEVAEPCLRRFGYPAVVFVPTGFIGGTNRFDLGREPAEPILGWEELEELQRRGVAVQSHGVSHRAFSALDLAAQAHELTSSKGLLDERLGAGVQVFAYPYGDVGRAPEKTGELLRRAGYQAALLYGGGPVTLPAASPFRLARIAMGPDTDLERKLGEAAAPPRGA